MNIAIVNKDKIESNFLREQIEGKLDHDATITIYQRQQDYLDALHNSSIHLAIIDTNQGIELARRTFLDDPSCIIVLSSDINDYARECYEINAKYFLLRPITDEDIETMLKTVIQEEHKEVFQLNQKTFIFADICSVQITDDAMLITTTQSNEVYNVMPNDDLMDKVENSEIFFTMDGEIYVNLKQVREMNGSSATLKNGIIIDL